MEISYLMIHYLPQKNIYTSALAEKNILSRKTKNYPHFQKNKKILILSCSRVMKEDVFHKNKKILTI